MSVLLICATYARLISQWKIRPECVSLCLDVLWAPTHSRFSLGNVCVLSRRFRMISTESLALLMHADSTPGSPSMITDIWSDWGIGLMLYTYAVLDELQSYLRSRTTRIGPRFVPEGTVLIHAFFRQSSPDHSGSILLHSTQRLQWLMSITVHTRLFINC